MRALGLSESRLKLAELQRWEKQHWVLAMQWALQPLLSGDLMLCTRSFSCLSVQKEAALQLDLALRSAKGAHSSLIISLLALRLAWAW